MVQPPSGLSTAEQRRPAVAAAAVQCFAHSGYHGTTIADIGREAGISTAYVFKLYPGKKQLFVAALDDCFEQIVAALEAGARRAEDVSPAGILDAMGAAYAELISDRSLLLLQVHAQSVSGVAEIATALRRGIAKVTRFVKSRSGADDVAVQRFMAYGQLCHLLVTSGIAEQPTESLEDWAALLSDGIRHPRS